MANTNFRKKAKIQDTENSGFGNYYEGVGGGGSPEAKDPAQRAPGVNSDYRKENNDTMQPRTDDGKFTYKSVNGESIDPKYGPSRGTTVNPLLTGGKNGIEINEVEKQFSNQSGVYWDTYKDTWYPKGGEKISFEAASHKKALWKTKVAGAAVWDVAKRRYDSVKGEFMGESSVFEESKSGKSSAEEKSAKQKAESGNQEEYVINKNTGGIKIKPGTVIPTPAPAPAPTPGPTPGPTPVVPNQPTQPTQPGASVNTINATDIINADYTPKYDDNTVAEFRQALQDAGFSDDELAQFDAMSPKQRDKFIDESVEEEDNSAPANNDIPNDDSEPKASKLPEKEEETETDAEKKIRKMGFTD